MKDRMPKLIYFNSRDELYRIDMQHIVYIEADGNYSHIVLRDRQRATICMSLMQMQSLLDERMKGMPVRFVRVGRRYIINIMYVYHIHSLRQRLALSDGDGFYQEIAISKDALRQLKEIFVKTLKN